jgi:hypothetical protein
MSNGKYWYCYATPELIGEFDSYSAMIADIDTALKVLK